MLTFLLEGAMIELSERHDQRLESDGAPPWLRWYENVPAHLSYPETTLYEVIAATAARTPDTIAWDFLDATQTYAQFLRSIDNCANALASLGLRAGERILIAMPTSPPAVIAFYAANKIGVVAAFVHPLFSVPELEQYLDATGARVVLTLDTFYEKFALPRPRLPMRALILVRIADYLSPLRKLSLWLTERPTRVPRDEQVRWWKAFLVGQNPTATRASIGTDDPAAILFSGGTSGTPKGIVLSSRNFIAEGMAVAAWGGGMRPSDSILAILPIFHGFCLGVCLNAAFTTGARSIMAPVFNPRITARLIRTKRPTIVVGVPTLYAALARDNSLAKTDLSCIRAGFCGGDALSSAIKGDFEQMVARRGGNAVLRQGYGLTETVTAVMAMPVQHHREGSMGVPLPDVLAKICRPGTTEALPPGEEGEICISGPPVMIGYLNDPEATEQALRRHDDGGIWLHTGDIGRMDADGYFYFVDRLKRMIKSSGFNVFPAQVEGVLRQHPLVADACVVGVPDPAQIARVKAFVVLKDAGLASPETESSLIAFCRTKLIKWSCPRDIEFLTDLPKTRIGKVDYRALSAREQGAGGEAAIARQAGKDGGAAVAATLRAHGVSLLFTLCGGHISPILVGAKAAGIRVIDVRNEATAVFAADAVSRLTGRPGVAAVTAGPGVTNTVTPLKNASLSQSPALLLGGAAPTLLQGRGALQDINQRPVVAPHVKFFRRLRRVRDIGLTVSEALAATCEGVQGPAFVECALDLLYEKTLVRQWYDDAAGKGKSVMARLRRFYVMRHFNRCFAESETLSPPHPKRAAVLAVSRSRVETAAECLARAERPLAIVGSQVLAAGTDSSRAAEALTRLGVPVYLSGLARGLLGREHPLQLHHLRRQAVKEADCVILAGTPCDFRLDYGRQIQQSSVLIAVNRSRKEARLNRRPSVIAIGDVGSFFERLAEHTAGSPPRWGDWTATLHARDSERAAEIERLAETQGEFVNPVALLHAIDRVAGDNAIFCADGGDFVATASYVIRPRGPRMWLDPGPFGTLGVGAGFGLAAALCRPDAEVWILFGDGACGYSLSEFDTFVRHGIPVIAVVGNDAGWTQIAREQKKLLGDDIGVVLARSAYHEVAAGFGAEGLLLKTSEEISGVLARARATAKSGKPVLINAWLDPTDFREGSISM